MFALFPQRIFIANRQWVEGKALVVRNGKIASIVSPSRLNRKLKIIELPGVGLMPGFVNAHTHLEFTDASFSKPRRAGFTAWVDAISSWKRSRSPGATLASISRGVRDCLAHGTVAVGDYYGGEVLPKALIASPLRGIVFHEVIGLDAEASGSKLATLKKRAKHYPHGDLRFGLAPHAPYSVNENLLRSIVSWAAAGRIPLSMHIAESLEEVTLARDGDNALGRWITNRTGQVSPIAGTELFAYLRGCGLFSLPTVAVHMNCLRPQDWKYLSPACTRIVHCPKSHAYFRHSRFALETFLQKGYCVAMGTDSLASNDALNMFEELRQARKVYPRVALETLWDMATVHGALSLGLSRSGKIQPGYDADLLAIPVSRTKRTLEEAFHHRGEVALTMIQGKIVWGTSGLRTSIKRERAKLLLWVTLNC